MKLSFGKFELVLAFVFLFGLLLESAVARDGTPLIRDVQISGVTKRIHVELRQFANVSSVTDSQLADLKVFVADKIEEYWRAYEAAEFNSPASETDDDGTEIIRAFYRFQPRGGGGSARATGFFQLNGQGLLSDTTRLSLGATIAHELFHKVQYNHQDLPNKYPPSFYEGTATLAAPLVDSPFDQSIAENDSCGSNYLKFPGWPLWFRPSVDDLTNVCNTAIWWKYLTQQFSSKAPDDFQNGIDTLLRLLKHLEEPTGWRQRGIDRVVAVGDFDGDNIDDLLLRSDLYVGIVSPIFRNPITHAVVYQGNRFGEKWRFDTHDRILGSCDITNDYRHEFIISSDTHFGIVGLNHNSEYKTIVAVNHGQQLELDGWRIAATDSVVGAGDFNGNGKCELLIKSNTHIGLIEYTNDGFTTLFARQFGSYIGGWRIKSDDEYLGVGDFNGDGKTDFAIRSATHVGFASYSATENTFDTLAVVQHRVSPLANGFPISRGDVLGTGRFANNLYDSLVFAESGGAYAVSVNSNSDLRTDASFSPQQLPRWYRGIVAIADLNGDGSDELVGQTADGTLHAMKLTPRLEFADFAFVARSVELTDGFPESTTLRRIRWTPSAELRILAVGDFDGDGRDDLFARDGSATLVLKVKEDNRFVIGQITLDNKRFDGLVAKLQTFIQKESGGDRTLRTMFADFAVTNYVSSMQGRGISDVYQYRDENIYPGSSDYDKNPSTPPLVHTDEITLQGGGSKTFSQRPWVTQYYQFDTSDQSIELAAQTNGANVNCAYTALLVEENNVLEISSLNCQQFTRTFRIRSPNQKVILMVTSFETPLKYEIFSASR